MEKKGEKKFQRISWDEALDTISEKWKKLIDKYGPESILPYSYLGNQGLVHGLNGADAFFNRMVPQYVKEHPAEKVLVPPGFQLLDRLQVWTQKVIYTVNIL